MSAENFRFSFHTSSLTGIPLLPRNCKGYESRCRATVLSQVEGWEGAASRLKPEPGDLSDLPRHSPFAGKGDFYEGWFSFSVFHIVLVF
jgi:hypothetical protein